MSTRSIVPSGPADVHGRVTGETGLGALVLADLRVTEILDVRVLRSSLKRWRAQEHLDPGLPGEIVGLGRGDGRRPLEKRTPGELLRDALELLVAHRNAVGVVERLVHHTRVLFEPQRDEHVPEDPPRASTPAARPPHL